MCFPVCGMAAETVRAAGPEPHRGRLELTWTNKDQCLLAHNDGSYEWVPSTDYRVAEVRLLRETGAVGDIAGPQNLLVRGDALNALTSLTKLPVFRDEYVGKVKLCYIDPPFNTGQAFTHYDDALEHSVWLTMLRDRLSEIRELLSPDGSVWVHLDDYEGHRARSVLDEAFGADRHIATVIWKKRHNLPNDRPLAANHDYILVYGSETAFNLRPRPEGHGGFSNPDGDPGGPWALHPIDANAKGGRHVDHLVYPIRNPNTGEDFYPPKGRNWAYSQEEVERRIRDGSIVFGKTGESAPKKKAYLKDVRGGLTWPTMWETDEFEDFPVNNDADQHIKALFGPGRGFETPKPERLLSRIISIATNPSDVVLDCFVGSGTTAAVAHKLGRRWVAVEHSPETLDAFAIPRLTKVIAGEDGGGVTADVGWTGGGGFRILDVGPSMFENDEGIVVLAEWATNSALAEATTAQLGYANDPAAPFCGCKGRTRLAVIDGLVSPTVIKLLVSALGEGELLTVCGTSVDQDAAAMLRSLRPGSRARKIPASLLAEYQEATRWQPRVPDSVEAAGNERTPAPAVPYEPVAEA